MEDTLQVVYNFSIMLFFWGSRLMYELLLRIYH
jgi:hypothetical protein